MEEEEIEMADDGEFWKRIWINDCEGRLCTFGEVKSEVLIGCLKIQNTRDFAHSANLPHNGDGKACRADCGGWKNRRIMWTKKRDETVELRNRRKRFLINRRPAPIRKRISHPHDGQKHTGCASNQDTRARIQSWSGSHHEPSRASPSTNEKIYEHDDENQCQIDAYQVQVGIWRRAREGIAVEDWVFYREPTLGIIDPSLLCVAAVHHKSEWSWCWPPVD
jgi:hypothetical protein